MENDCASPENVEDFSPSQVEILACEIVFSRAVLCPNTSDGLGFTRLTNSWESRNLKIVFDSASLFIRQKLVFAFVSLIFIRTSGTR